MTEDLDGGEYLFAIRMLMVLFRREFSFLDALYLWEVMTLPVHIQTFCISFLGSWFYLLWLFTKPEDLAVCLLSSFFFCVFCCLGNENNVRWIMVAADVGDGVQSNHVCNIRGTRKPKQRSIRSQVTKTVWQVWKEIHKQWAERATSQYACCLCGCKRSTDKEQTSVEGG